MLMVIVAREAARIAGGMQRQWGSVQKRAPCVFLYVFTALMEAYNVSTVSSILNDRMFDTDTRIAKAY